jgi:hypothetical protein
VHCIICKQVYINKIAAPKQIFASSLVIQTSVRFVLVPFYLSTQYVKPASIRKLIVLNAKLWPSVREKEIISDLKMII